jgi:hypothetical protein
MIKTKADLEWLQKGQVFSATFISFLEEEFEGLKEAFSFEEDSQEFALDHNGFICVLEKGDNLYDLSVVGLSRKEGGLLGSLPEYVDRIGRDNEVWYKIVCVFTNDFAGAFYLQENDVPDERIREWFDGQTEMSL